MTDTNQASEDELKKRMGNLHAYNYEGDDVTVKVMVDEYILESIAKFVESIIRTEKTKLLAEVRERVVGEDEDTQKWEDSIDRQVADECNQLRAEMRTILTKLEAEL